MIACGIAVHRVGSVQAPSGFQRDALQRGTALVVDIAGVRATPKFFPSRLAGTAGTRS